MSESSRSDRDILIQVETNVKSLHVQLLGGNGQEGRIPKLESDVEEHAKHINTAKGSIGTLVWILGGVVLLIVTLAGVLMAHVLGGK